MCGNYVYHHDCKRKSKGEQVFSGQRFRIKGKKVPGLYGAAYIKRPVMKDLRGEVMILRVCIVPTNVEMAIYNG